MTAKKPCAPAHPNEQPGQALTASPSDNGQGQIDPSDLNVLLALGQQWARSLTPEEARKRADKARRDNQEKFTHWILLQTMGAQWSEDFAENDGSVARFMAAHFFNSHFDQSDPIEAALGAQMFAMHAMSMEAARRSMIKEQHVESRKYNMSAATKASRAYAQLLDSLSRHRGKGQQSVRVEHVHVHEGGQAIVGSVEAPGGSGGRSRKGNMTP